MGKIGNSNKRLLLTDIVSPEVFEWDVAVPTTEQVEVLPMQNAGVLASRTRDPATRQKSTEDNIFHQVITENKCYKFQLAKFSRKKFSVPGVRREGRDGGPHPAASAAEDAVAVRALVRVVLAFKTWRRTQASPRPCKKSSCRDILVASLTSSSCICDEQ